MQLFRGWAFFTTPIKQMQDTFAEIICNNNLVGSYWTIGLKTNWKNYRPGQFVMLDLPGTKTFLRRPFSIASLKKGILEICYKVVGAGTFSLSHLGPGEKMWGLGPLGNGFNYKNNGEAIFVAGGYGIAPFVGLSDMIKGRDTHLFYGAKRAEDLLYLSTFKKNHIELHITTEDGSAGSRGLVTSALLEFLRATKDKKHYAIYACGPHSMLAMVKDVAEKFKLADNCQLSLESYMACGIGTCMGCVVKGARGEYIRVCKEGPVFYGTKIKC